MQIVRKIAKTKYIDWIYRYYLFLWTLLPLTGFTFSAVIAGTEFSSNSVPFLIYFLLIAFTLPSLISKNLLGRNIFDIRAAYAFLIYPAIYIAGVLLKNFNISLDQFYPLAGILIILLWNILVGKMIYKAKFTSFIKSSKEIAFSITPFLIFLLVTLITRDFGSIISTDVLVHKTVLNGMEVQDTVGFMPDSYSSTFTDQAYPIVMYHTFLYMAANAFQFNYSLVGYFLDIFLTLIFTLASYQLFRKYFTAGWSALGVTLALFVFENLAYSAHFFIPQTFCFLLFLLILNTTKLNIGKLLASIIILTLTHFYIGIFLSILLITKYLYIEKTLKIGEKKENNLFVREAFFVLLLLILASATGFSIERIFQRETVQWVGALSNPDFKGEITAIFDLLGYTWIIFIPVLLRVAFKQRRTTPETIGYIGIVANLSAYFLGPVFAGKFLLGFGLFSSLILISYLKELKPKTVWLYFLIAGCLVISYAVNYNLLFRELSSFLSQENGSTTAIVDKDESLVNYWQEQKPQCVLISDPQTQLTIHSLGKGESLRGNYMTLHDRKILIDFISTPRAETLAQLQTMEDLSDPWYKDTEICLGISARLLELASSEHNWQNYIFTYKVDHFSKLDTSAEVLKFLSQSAEQLYQDEYHKVYLLQ